IAEELLLTLGTAVTGGAIAPEAAAIGATRAVRAFNKIGKSWGASRDLLKTLDTLRDVNQARSRFQKAAGNYGKFLNPVGETAEFAKSANLLKNMSADKKALLGFASTYRDVRNLRLAWGESGLEGGMVENQMQDLL